MLRSVMSPKELWLLAAFAGALCLAGVSLYVHHRAGAESPPVVETTAPGELDPVEPVALPPVEPANAQAADLPVLPYASVSSEPLESVSVAVSVVGAVAVPGVYKLAEDGRVKDLVDAAGGPSEEADLSDINLAAKLIDGSTLTVPARATAQRDGNRLVLRRPESARALNPPQYTISGWHVASRTHSLGRTDIPDGIAPGTSSGLLDLNRAPPGELESLPGIGPKLSAEIAAYRKRTPFQTVDDVMNVSGIGPKKLEAIRPLVTVGGL